LGIKTLRFWNSEISENLEKVVNKILNNLDGRTPSPFQEKG